MGELEDLMNEHEGEGHECVGCLEKKCKKELKDLIAKFMDEDLTPTHIIGILKSVVDDFTFFINTEENEDSEDPLEDKEEEKDV